jgi:hypothetical protein
MTDGMIALGDLAPPIPPVSKFFDDSFITLAAGAKP